MTNSVAAVILLEQIEEARQQLEVERAKGKPVRYETEMLDRLRETTEEMLTSGPLCLWNPIPESLIYGFATPTALYAVLRGRAMNGRVLAVGGITYCLAHNGGPVTIDQMRVAVSKKMWEVNGDRTGVSDSTIRRWLFKLREEGLVIAVGLFDPVSHRNMGFRIAVRVYPQHKRVLKAYNDCHDYVIPVADLNGGSEDSNKECFAEVDGGFDTDCEGTPTVKPGRPLYIDTERETDVYIQGVEKVVFDPEDDVPTDSNKADNKEKNGVRPEVLKRIGVEFSRLGIPAGTPERWAVLTEYKGNPELLMYDLITCESRDEALALLND